jgi:hypothetical protein
MTRASASLATAEQHTPIVTAAKNCLIMAGRIADRPVYGATKKGSGSLFGWTY